MTACVTLGLTLIFSDLDRHIRWRVKLTASVSTEAFMYIAYKKMTITLRSENTRLNSYLSAKVPLVLLFFQRRDFLSCESCTNIDGNKHRQAAEITLTCT